MKKLTLLLTLLVSGSWLFGQVVWDNFEDQRKAEYGFINGTFIPYNENPDKNGNTSLVAASYTRNPAELFDVIILDAPMANLADYTSGAKTMSIDVWAPDTGITIQITLENSVTALPANFPTGRHSVYLTKTTVKEAWETLTFTFDNRPDGTVPDTDVDRMVLLFAPNTNTDGAYFWDNLNGPELANDPCDGVSTDPTIFNDFECQQNVNFTFSHGGVNFRRVANPDSSAGNPSSYVASYTRNAAEENDVIVGTLPPGSTGGNPITLNVWDPNAPTTVVLSLQRDGQEVVALTDSTSNSSQWETLTFDASGFGDSVINGFVILFDPGNFSSDNYFFDDFVLGEATSIKDLVNLGSVKSYPNPTSGLVTIEYDLKKSGMARIDILDIVGRQVAERDLGQLPMGSNKTQFDVSNLSPGLYFYRLNIDGASITRRMIVE